MLRLTGSVWPVHCTERYTAANIYNAHYACCYSYSYTTACAVYSLYCLEVLLTVLAVLKEYFSAVQCV
jgi:hypothetical protein